MARISENARYMPAMGLLAYGNDRNGHEIRFWKDPSVPSMNPNKPDKR